MFKFAFKNALPAIFCYFLLGIVYGLLFVEQGHPWYLAPIFSAFAYAGAIQFLALTLVALDSSMLTMAIALIPLGLRNIFYGLTMLQRYKGFPLFFRFILAHGLVDATYSILQTGPTYEEINDRRYIYWLSFLIYLSWPLGTFLGAVANQLIPLPSGLEFCMTAFFAASAVEHFLKNRDYKPFFIAGGSIIAAIFIMPHHFFLAGVSIAFLSCVAMPMPKRKTV